MLPSPSKQRLELALEEKFREACDGKSSLSYHQFVDVTGCRSEFFAKRLFEAIDTDDSGDISFDEFLHMIHLLQSRDTEARKKFIFDLLDVGHTGFITETELRHALGASLEEGDMSTSQEERESLLSSLLRFFDLAEDSPLTFDKFGQAMDLYPDTSNGFSLEGMALSVSHSEPPKNTKKLHQAKRWIINHPQFIFTYTLLFLILIGCFYWRFQRYIWSCDDLTSQKCKDGKKRDLMGYSLPIAKGAGQAMKAIFTLILIPVSRNLMTHLRSTSLKYIFNFDTSIDFHKALGTIGFILAWIHTLCHVCDVKRWADSSRRHLYFAAFPHHDTQPSIIHLLKSQVFITGLCLISIYTIAALFALDYPRKLSVFHPARSHETPTWIQSVGKCLNNFNHFWYTHQLFAAFYLCLVLHPQPALPDEATEWAVSDSWAWIMVPATIYLLERLSRAIMTDVRDTAVLSAQILSGNVLELKVMKPRGLVYIAGQYVFLNCPEVSRFEWHPFTLTSSPGDSYLGVHIRVAGDWTAALYDLVKKTWTPKAGSNNSIRRRSSLMFSRQRSSRSILVKSVSGLLGEVNPDSCPFRIKVDGPFGAPTQNFKDYKVIVLIGAGIGVTPFASVLNELLDVMQNHKCCKCGAVNLPKTFRVQKVYFYWTVRSREEAAWFKQMLEAISLQDEDGFIDINIHITSFRRANDLRVMLVRLAQIKAREMAGVDPLAGMRTRAVTNFGRPNWKEVFEGIREAHKHQTRHCGVFYCGPNSLNKVPLGQYMGMAMGLWHRCWRKRRGS